MALKSWWFHTTGFNISINGLVLDDLGYHHFRKAPYILRSSLCVIWKASRPMASRQETDGHAFGTKLSNAKKIKQLLDQSEAFWVVHGMARA